MSDRSKNILITIGIILCISLFSWWWFSTFKTVEEEKRNFVSEYYRNDYFVLEKFLNKLDIETTSSKSASDIILLDETTGTVALFNSPNIFSQEINAHLKDWINNGGTLITDLPSNIKGMQSDFFSSFGINMDIANDEISELDTEYLSDYEYDREYEDFFNLIETDYNYGDDVNDCKTHNDALIDCGDIKNITATRNYTVLAQNNDLNAYIKVSYGLGSIIVINQSSTYKNRLVHNIDNAYFFTTMLNQKNPKLLIVNRSGTQSLFDVLWAQFKLQIILLCILIIAVIWSLFQRFGPMREIELESRQDLRKHLQASADYLWKVDLLKQNLVKLRNETSSLIMRRLGKILDTQDTAMREIFLKHIHEHTSDLSQNEIYQAFFGNLPVNEKELILITQRLQMIRSKL